MSGTLVIGVVAETAIFVVLFAATKASLRPFMRKIGRMLSS